VSHSTYGHGIEIYGLTKQQIKLIMKFIEDPGTAEIAFDMYSNI